MTEKRFQLNKDTEWWFVKDNTIKVNEFGYRDDVIGEDKYRGLKQELTEEETVELLNEQQATINKQLDKIIELQDKYRILEFNHSRLEKRNKAQYEKIDEQQATINRLENIIFNLKNEIYNLKDDKDYYMDKKRFDLYD